MEVSVKVNSSLTVGVASGLLIGTAIGLSFSSNSRKCFKKLASKLRTAFQGTAIKAEGVKGSTADCKAGSSAVKEHPRNVDAAVKSTDVDKKDDGEGPDIEVETSAQERASMWYRENNGKDYAFYLTLKKVTFDSRSPFQHVQVIETNQFGRTLVMDSQTQSTEVDEHVYHESLVHPAMLAHGNPKSVFIGGGGEFATAREVLRHKSVERCQMVDIDKVACDICREQLPEWNAGAYEDPRFSIEYSDAFAWLKNCNEKFDVIIMDICDPVEAGPGYKLYTNEFYTFLIKERLSPGGIFVTQSGPCAIYNAKAECFTTIHKTLESSFDVVIPYAADVPSFGSMWGFNMAFSPENNTDVEAAKRSVLEVDAATIDEKLENAIEGGLGKLKFLDGISYRGLVGISKKIRKECENEDRVMTIDNPVFMYSA